MKKIYVFQIFRYGESSYTKNQISIKSYFSYRQGLREENDCSYKVATAPMFDTGCDLYFNGKWICIEYNL